MNIETEKQIEESTSRSRWEGIKAGWYRFKQDPLPLLGLGIVVFAVFAAVFAPLVAPYPEQAYLYINYDQQYQPPSWQHLFGTDKLGRDIFSRVLFGFRFSLGMAGSILSIAAPPGILLGLIAGYYRDTWIDSLIMRVSDVFISVPPLVLAMAVCSVLKATVFNAMMAVTLMWWPWYTRLTYNQASSVRTEYYVTAAEITGSNPRDIMFKDILPNCIGPILTKITLDLGWVILIGATLSFVGLGAQPPTPDLGTMTSESLDYIMPSVGALPKNWWTTIFPALSIAFLVLGFNLLGDGINRILAKGETVR